MSDAVSRISFTIHPGAGRAFTQETAESLVGQAVQVKGGDGSPVDGKVVAADLRDDGGLWVTIETPGALDVLTGALHASLSPRPPASGRQ